jgi:hypothetical protein
MRLPIPDVAQRGYDELRLAPQTLGRNRITFDLILTDKIQIICPYASRNNVSPV